MTAAIPLQRSNNWLNKPTGTGQYVGFQINPWSGVKMTVEIWKSYMWTADKEMNVIFVVMNST